MKQAWKSLIGAVVVALAARSSSAQIPKITVAQEFSCPNANPVLAWITDGNAATDCTVGGGSNRVLCQCISGVWSAVSGAGGSGETNTASNLGGGLANFSAKVGVDLQFNSFDSADFDLASNLITIDATKWAKLSDVPTSADYLVKTADAGLSAERVVTDTATVTWDWATAAQAKANLSIASEAQGDVLFRGASAWSRLAANTAGKVLTTQGAGADPTWSYQQGTTLAYDPDAPPATCWACDEFDGTSTVTWRWGNQGTSTNTVALGAAKLAPEAAAGNNRRVRWTDAPSAVDFTVTTKLSFDYTNDHNQGGIVVLESGTEASPTKMWLTGPYGSSGAKFGAWSATSYTSGNTDLTNPQYYSFGTGIRAIVHHIQLRYVASTKALSFYTSPDGIGWHLIYTATLSAHPVSVGIYANPDNGSVVGNVFAQYFRVLTDSAAVAAPYPSGGNAPVLTSAQMLYSPDAQPIPCAKCDDFDGGVEDQTWTAGNFTGATKSLVNDGMMISTPTSSTMGYNCQWIAPPASGNWLAVTKMHPDGEGDVSSDVALAVMTSGTIASPTGIEFAFLRGTSAITQVEVDYNASGYVPTAVRLSGTSYGPTGSPGYFAWLHDDAANTLAVYSSHGGIVWQKLFSYASMSPPVFVGPCVQNGNFAESTRGFYEWFRILTDASQTVEPFLIGARANALTGANADVTSVGDCASGACFSAVNTGTQQVFSNATSGTVTVTPQPGIALGTKTAYLYAPTTGLKITSKPYDPDTPPPTGLDTARSDEFDGGAQLTWSNVNSGPTSDTFAHDSAEMVQSAESRNIRGKTAGGSTISSDFSVYAKLYPSLNANYETVGIVLLDGGSWATPTKLWECALQYDSGISFGAAIFQSMTSYAGAGATNVSTQQGDNLVASNGAAFYLRVKYVASTKNLACYFSYSGQPNSWQEMVTHGTLTAHPDIARFVDAITGSGSVYSTVAFWRVFVSGTNGATSAQYASGEMGY